MQAVGKSCAVVFDMLECGSSVASADWQYGHDGNLKGSSQDSRHRLDAGYFGDGKF